MAKGADQMSGFLRGHVLPAAAVATLCPLGLVAFALLSLIPADWPMSVAVLTTLYSVAAALTALGLLAPLTLIVPRRAQFVVISVAAACLLMLVFVLTPVFQELANDQLAPWKEED